jgi:hypothetical protein
MKYTKIITFLAIVCLLVSQNLVVRPAFAVEFDPNQIITDDDLNDFDSMDLVSIQEFLNNQSGILKNYQSFDALGVSRSAAEIIYNSALTNIINPKWILATLQKEQSLITDPNPTQRDLDWAMGYGVCDDCTTDDPYLQKFKGFGMQVERASARVRYYTDNPSQFNFQVGKSMNVDGQNILPYNQATANLYNYTPHLHGNYNFWNIWYRWFSKIFPDGTLVRAVDDTVVYLIKNGQRRAILSKSVLISRFDPLKVIEVSNNDLQSYQQGASIKYPNYSLLKSPAGKIYLLVNDEKKEIESEDVFKTIGYNPEEVIDVTDEELASYAEGRKITMDSVYPQGALLQDSKSGGIFYVEDGIKYPIIAKEILNNNFSQYKITKVTSAELDKYIKAANGVKLKDGTLILVKGDNKVYAISNGERRWIVNESTFEQLGYKWNSIITVSDKVASLHSLGEDLDALGGKNTQMASQ